MYVSTLTAPKTLSPHEVVALMKTTGKHRDGFRDHVMFAFALATGLREHELVALNWGDVCTPAGARRVVRLETFKRSNDDRDQQEVRLPDGVRRKLERLRVNARRDGLPHGDVDAVFMSARKKRISLRMVRHAFKIWQGRAGFDRLFTFHALRHTAITNAYRVGGKDIRLAQRFARHASIISTQRYTHASDADLCSVAESMPC